MKIRYRYPKLCNGFDEKFINSPNFKLIVIQYLQYKCQKYGNFYIRIKYI